MDFYIDPNLLESYAKNLRYTVIYGGRGSGKSLQLGALSIIYAIQNPNSRILCVRGTQNKISESSLQILKDVISMMGIDEFFIITEHTLECKNGSQFIFYGAKNYMSFKSLQGIDIVFIDEATELCQEAWDVLTPTVREDNSRFLISFNPEKETDAVYDMFITNKHPDATVTFMNYPDNPFFPQVLQKEMEYDKKINLLKYNHKWMGELEQAPEGALWTRNMIKYEKKPVKFDQIVISIDPSTTDKITSDECGIMAVGKAEGLYYVLEDVSAILSPLEWGKRAIKLYDKYNANRIVYESNQGGMMVKTIIHQIRETIKCVSYHARKSKIARAEEIVSLYEQGKVKHVKKLTQLEFEQCTFTGKKSDKSPNRLDALVYALKNLSTTMKNGRRTAAKMRTGSMTLKY